MSPRTVSDGAPGEGCPDIPREAHVATAKRDRPKKVGVFTPTHTHTHTRGVILFVQPTLEPPTYSIPTTRPLHGSHRGLFR